MSPATHLRWRRIKAASTSLFSRGPGRHERFLLLMGLNLGFAQSEAISFRHEDVQLDADPPHIGRVRRKTGKYFKVALWPEMIQAIQWNDEQRKGRGHNEGPWVLLTEKGNRPTAQHIANTWNRLVKRVQKDQPDFRHLPFKFLRKTAYQLVKEASGSEEVAGAFQARGRLSSDQYASAYGRRLFGHVFEANLQVHEQLQPMFAAAPDAFDGPRKRGGANITPARIEGIQRLWREGVRPAEIARVTGTTRQTVYRYRPEATTRKRPAMTGRERAELCFLANSIGPARENSQDPEFSRADRQAPRQDAPRPGTCDATSVPLMCRGAPGAGARRPGRRTPSPGWPGFAGTSRASATLATPTPKKWTCPRGTPSGSTATDGNETS